MADNTPAVPAVQVRGGGDLRGAVKPQHGSRRALYADSACGSVGCANCTWDLHNQGRCTHLDSTGAWGCCTFQQSLMITDSLITSRQRAHTVAPW
jgi:hypothetical protein